MKRCKTQFEKLKRCKFFISRTDKENFRQKGAFQKCRKNAKLFIFTRSNESESDPSNACFSKICCLEKIVLQILTRLKKLN